MDAQPTTLITNPLFIACASATAAALVFRPAIMSRLFGHATTRYFHSPKSLELPLRNSSPSSTTTTLASLCSSVIPPCTLNPFAFNGHLQTIWTTIVGKDTVHVYYKRHTIRNTDPAYTGHFTVDFVVEPYEGRAEGLPPRTTHYTDAEVEALRSDDARPMLVVLHGLTGGSYELYLRSVLAPLVAEGWAACVVNSRGCAGSEISSSVLYNARSTWDVRQVVPWLRERFPNRPLFGCGFSLGANIITNYIGEEGSKCEFKAAVVLSSPWNLEAGSLALQRTWLGLNVYSKAMGANLKGLFERHVEQISQNPEIDVAAVRKLKYLHEFDRLVQGPTWGYPTEGAYYRDAASTDSLMAVRIPLLAINAYDDPIAAAEACPFEEVKQTPYCVLCMTSLGGHLGWFKLGGGRWFADATAAFLQKMVRDVDLNKISKGDDSLFLGQISRPKREPLRPVFVPMRRRMHVPEKETAS